ncbi:MAG: hypothetical protein GEU28_12905 [Dehalococcoidia bacterium]|nr:hypothetical protein [Dehalococcoidia bacterium]
MLAGGVGGARFLAGSWQTSRGGEGVSYGSPVACDYGVISFGASSVSTSGRIRPSRPPGPAEIGLQDRYAPDTGPIDEVEEFIRLVVVERATPPPGTQLGEMPIDGWIEYMNFLLEGRTGSPDDPLTFEEPLDLTQIIDNSLNSEIMDFDQEAIRQEARDYQTSS